MPESLSDEQRQALGALLHVAFKEIRMLSWEEQSKQAADLADAVCQLPLRLFSSDFQWERYERSLNNYQERYQSSQSFDYVQMLKYIQTEL